MASMAVWRATFQKAKEYRKGLADQLRGLIGGEGNVAAISRHVGAGAVADVSGIGEGAGDERAPPGRDRLDADAVPHAADRVRRMAVAWRGGHVEGPGTQQIGPVVVEDEGPDQLVVVAGRPAHDRDRRTGDAVDAVEQRLLIAREAVGHGITHIDMPATPERVWQAIRVARG